MQSTFTHQNLFSGAVVHFSHQPVYSGSQESWSLGKTFDLAVQVGHIKERSKEHKITFRSCSNGWALMTGSACDPNFKYSASFAKLCG